MSDTKNDMGRKELIHEHGLIKTIQRGFELFIYWGQMVQKNIASLKEFRGTNEEIKKKKEELLLLIKTLEDWEWHILQLLRSCHVSDMRFPSDKNTRIMRSFRDSVRRFPSGNITRIMNDARHTLTNLSKVISPIKKFAEDEYKLIGDNSIERFGDYLETVEDTCREKLSCKEEVYPRQKRLEELKNDMESKELIHEHGLIKTIQSGFELFIDWGQMVQNNSASLKEFRGTNEEIKKKKEDILLLIKTLEDWERHILLLLRSWYVSDTSFPSDNNTRFMGSFRDSVMMFPSDNNSRIMEDSKHTLCKLSIVISPIKKFAEDEYKSIGDNSIERFGDYLKTVKDTERQMQQEDEQTKIKHVSTVILDSNNENDVCEPLKSIEIESEESSNNSWCYLIEEEEMETLKPTEMLSEATKLSENYPKDPDRAWHYLFAAIITTIAQFFARGGCDLSTRDYEKRRKCLDIIAGIIVSDGNDFYEAYTKLDHFLKAFDVVNYNMDEYVENIQQFISKLENACDDDVKKVVEKVLSDKPVEITDLEEKSKKIISGISYNINFKLS